MKTPKVKEIMSKVRDGTPMDRDAVKNIGLEWDIWHHDQTFIAKYFVQQCWKYKRDFWYFDGNVVCIDKPTVPCFVAHMDTVADKSMNKQLMLDGDEMYRSDAILGADDRAGVQIIWDLFHDVNFILTRDEERGGLGAASVSKCGFVKDRIEELKVPCFFEFDRKDCSHIIGVNNSYCTADLSDDIQAIAPDYHDDTGTFTDIDKLTALGIQGVNLSVGYYQQHSKSEYLNLTQYARARELARELADAFTGASIYKWKESDYVRKYTYPSTRYTYGNTLHNYRSSSVGYTYCCMCGDYLSFPAERECGECADCQGLLKKTKKTGVSSHRHKCSDCGTVLLAREVLEGKCHSCSAPPAKPPTKPEVVPVCPDCDIELMPEEESQGTCWYCKLAKENDWYRDMKGDDDDSTSYT